MVQRLFFAGQELVDAHTLQHIEGPYYQEARLHDNIPRPEYTLDLVLSLTIHIQVAGITGTNMQLDVDAMNTVRRVKARIQDQRGFHPKDQRLIFAGQQLEDDRRVIDYGVVENGMTLHLVLKLWGGAKCFVRPVNFVSQAPVGSPEGQILGYLCFYINGATTVLSLKERIALIEAVPVGQQHIFFAGQELN